MLIFFVRGTNNLEWYSPQQVTTTEGKLAITLDERETHDLDYAGGMITTWNKYVYLFTKINLELVN